jgi:hypothetical protein
MIGPRHLHAGSETPRFVADSFVVGGDHDMGKIAGHGNTLVDVFEHGSRVKKGQRFSGEA